MDVVQAMSLTRGASTNGELAWAEMSARPSCPPVLQVFARGDLEVKVWAYVANSVEMSAH